MCGEELEQKVDLLKEMKDKLVHCEELFFDIKKFQKKLNYKGVQ